MNRDVNGVEGHEAVPSRGSRQIIDLTKDDDSPSTQIIGGGNTRIVADLTFENYPHGFWYIDLTCGEA